MWELQKAIQIYIAAKRQDDRSHLADSMIVDGYNGTAVPALTIYGSTSKCAQPGSW